jgi:hypothetical protein
MAVPQWNPAATHWPNRRYLALVTYRSPNAQAANLRSLNLSDTKVTDVGVGRLNGLAKLQSLGLSRTQVTDAGLERLKGRTNLKHLGIKGAKVTDGGVNDLQTALPNLRIVR